MCTRGPARLTRLLRGSAHHHTFERGNDAQEVIHLEIRRFGQSGQRARVVRRIGQHCARRSRGIVSTGGDVSDRVLGAHGVLGPHQSDGGPLRRRTAGSSSPRRAASSRSFDRLADPTPTVVRRPAHPGPQLLGPRPARPGARPRASRPTPYVYVLYTYDAPIGRHGAALGHGRRDVRRLPDAARGRRATAASSAAGCRGLHGRRQHR